MTFDFWTRRLTQSIDQFFYLPLALLMGIGLIVALLLAGRQRSHGLRILRSDALAVGLIVLAGYLALPSASNTGSGFAVPFVPLVIAVAIAAIIRIPSPLARNVVVAAVLVVSAFNLAAKANLAPGMPATVSAGGRTVADERGQLQRYVAGRATLSRRSPPPARASPPVAPRFTRSGRPGRGPQRGARGGADCLFRVA